MREMNRYDFNIGIKIQCKNGRCGKLRKLVVDKKTLEITDLIVDKGYLMTTDRVIPISDIEQVTDDYIYLSVTKSEFDMYPKYDAYQYDVLAQDSTRKSVCTADLLYRITPQI
jgi:cell shape-determining protein MreC